MNLFLLFLLGCFLWGMHAWKTPVRQQMWTVAGIVVLLMLIYYALPRYI